MKSKQNSDLLPIIIDFHVISPLVSFVENPHSIITVFQSNFDKNKEISAMKILQIILKAKTKSKIVYKTSIAEEIHAEV